MNGVDGLEERWEGSWTDCGFSYKPPVEIEYGQPRVIDGGIDDAVLLTIERTLDIKVDKDELMRAMKYDRGQYEKGYADGVASRKSGMNKAEILRLCNEIKMIMCEIYNTGHTMQNCDYEAVDKRLKAIAAGITESTKE